MNNFTLYNMVDYLKEGSGAPTRVFAIIAEATNAGDQVAALKMIFVIAIVTLVVIQHPN
jgi:hypothetical protein